MEYKFIDAGVQEKSFNDDERSFIAYASKNTIDRDNEIIEATAWDYANYKKNPVILWAHDYRTLPVGKAMWVKRTDDGLLFKPSFADTEEGNKIYSLYKEGILNAFSVGFNPRKGYDPREDKDKERKKPKWIHTDTELLEISCVTVPAHQDALVNIYNDADTPEGLKIMIKGILPANRLPEKDLPQVYGIEDIDFTIEEESLYEKPYKNEHACRLMDPDDFQKDSFRTMEREHEGKMYRVIMGKLKGKDSMTDQAYRYKKGTWSESEAKNHCKAHHGMMFEPAMHEESIDTQFAKLEDKIDSLIILVRQMKPELLVTEDLNGGSEIDKLLSAVEKELDKPAIEKKPELKDLEDDIKKAIRGFYLLLGKVE